MIALVAVLAVVVAGVALRPRTARPSATAARVLRVSRRTARRDAERAFPDAIELIVLAVRSGHVPAAAVAAAVPHLPPAVNAPFAEVVARTQSGARFADALSALTEHLGPTAAPLVDSFAAADRYGLPLAPVLDRLAEEARRQRRRQADTLARQLPIRMSIPLVLCTLPSFVFLAIVPLLIAALSSVQR